MAVRPFPVAASRNTLENVGDGFADAMNLPERVLAAALLFAATPVLVGCSIAIAALARRTPFLAHERMGRGGRPIWVFKLRTMWSAERGASQGWLEKMRPDDSAFTPKRPTDPRVSSRFAAFCRKFSIDEIPQLWNVVRGEMALVGPRPLTRGEIDRHYGIYGVELLSRKPGITGLWQVRGRSRLSYQQRRRLDLLLVRRFGPAIYAYVVLATIPNVLLGKNAW